MVKLQTKTIMQKDENLPQLLKSLSSSFHPVIDFKADNEKIISIDLSNKNKKLAEIDFENTAQLGHYINQFLDKNKARYAFGGYDELRTVYSRSTLFNKNLGQNLEEEPRRLHLGTDIWAKAGTPVYAPMEGRIHSFAFNDHFGDYGATLILEHTSGRQKFHTLYGHISLKDLEGFKKDAIVCKGDLIAHFGNEKENGYWPPHLHFQIINDMHGFEGDYPGVCKLSERKKYLQNCPDPDMILNFKKYII